MGVPWARASGSVAAGRREGTMGPCGTCAAPSSVENSNDNNVIASVTGNALNIKVKLSRMNVRLNMFIYHSSRN